MLQQLVNGLILGSVYALLALGYTMVYGIIKLINFAHGIFYMVGAFMGYFLLNSWKMKTSLSLALCMVGTAILGVVIEYLAYRPLLSFNSDCCLDHIHQGFLSCSNMGWSSSSCQYPFLPASD